MKLKRRFVLFTILAAILMLLSFQLLLTIFLLPNLQEQETSLIKNSAERLDSALSVRLDFLSQVVADWAMWDPSYDFIHGDDPGYVSLNLGNSMFSNLRLSAVLISNDSGDIIYERYYDIDKNIDLNISDDSRKQIASRLRMAGNKTGISGLIPEGGRIMLFAAHKITSSDNTRHSSGYIAFARYLDMEETDYLGKYAGIPVRIEPFNRTGPEGFTGVEEEISPGVYKKYLNDEYVDCIVELRDLDNKPVGFAHMEMYRHEYIKSKENLNYFYALQVICILLVCVIIYANNEKSVMRKIADINGAISEMIRTGDISRTVNVEADEEIVDLAANFNRLIKEINVKESLLSEKNEELEASNQKLNEIIDFLPDAALVIDNDKKVIAWNKALEELTGVHKEQVIGRGDYAYSTPFYGEKRPIMIDFLDAEEDALRDKYSVVRRIGGTLYGETYVPAAYNGKGAYLWCKASPLYNENGERIGSIETIRDITERKNNEEALKKSQNDLYLKNILLEGQSEASIDGILVVDLNGKTLLYNKRFAEMWSIPQELLDLKDNKRMIDYVLNQLKEPGKFVRKVEYLYSHLEEKGRDEILFKDGRTFEEYSSPLIDPDGRTLGRIWYFRDITEHKKDEERIRESEERYRNIFENSVEGMYQSSPEGDRININPAFARIFGYDTPEEMQSELKTLEEMGDKLYPNADFNRTVIQPVIKNGFIKDMEIDCIKRDGTKIWISLNAKAIRGGKGEIALFEASVQDITDRKRAQEALKESERKLSDIIDFLPDAAVVIDNDKKVIAWNKAVEEMTGVLKKDILGRGDYAYSVPFYGEKRPILIDLIDIPEETLRDKYYFVKKIGSTLYGETYVPATYNGKGAYLWGKASPLFDAKGNRIGSIETIRDVTEKRKYEKALKKTQVQQRALLDNIPDIAWLKDEAGSFIAVNEPLARSMGVKKEELIGKTDLDVSPKELAEKYRADDAVVIASGQRKEVVEQLRDSVKGMIWIETIKTPIFGESGKVMGTVGIARDITARKNAENLLIEKEEMYRSLVESAGDIIVSIDASGKFTFFGHRAEEITGYKSEEVIGKSFGFIMSPKSLPVALENMGKRIKGEAITPYEVEIRTKSGREIPLEIFGHPILKEGVVTGDVIVARDITERKTAEGIIEKEMEELRELDAMKDDFLALTAHEMKTPLVSVLNIPDLMLDDKNLSEEQRQYLQMLISEGRRLKMIINRILIETRMNAGKLTYDFVPCNIGEIIENHKGWLEIAFKEHGLDFKVRMPKDLPQVKADRDLIGLALMNLLDNALKFTLEGGRVEVGAKVQDEEIIVWVKDTGIGIREEDLPKIFDKFHRGEHKDDRTYEGTGLGLHLSKGIIDAHGGRIWVESAIGKGTTFYFSIPIDKQKT